MLEFEKSLLTETKDLLNARGSFSNNNANKNIVIGVDEVGRGCIAGPVVATAFAIDLNFNFKDKKLPIIRDSKTLSALQRAKAKDFIEKHFITKTVSICNNEIDKINILNASLKAMELACKELDINKEDIALTLVDGNKLPSLPSYFNPKAVIKGDSKSFAIACASIIAKEHRDNFMKNLAKDYNYYGFERNKGYGTKEHKDAILKHGLSPYHRFSFKLK